jgi:hypothetical protein
MSVPVLGIPEFSALSQKQSWMWLTRTAQQRMKSIDHAVDLQTEASADSSIEYASE